MILDNPYHRRKVKAILRENAELKLAKENLVKEIKQLEKEIRTHKKATKRLKSPDDRNIVLWAENKDLKNGTAALKKEIEGLKLRLEIKEHK